ncbi:MAG TPA: RHS repeat-associated core domain-containing protein [Candidatus Dormibacteraeota bacterium]|nr:RHS repeat-associated core domain-containing protein [Candidatus Dormibacteraeota bacterium]
MLHQSGSTTLDGVTYTVDNAGNRTSRTPQPTGTPTNYDAIYELTQATGLPPEVYTYDAVGNRLSSTGSPSYSYNSSNELTSRTGVTYTYDNNGNMLATMNLTNTTTYTWDFENRLASVTLPGSGGTVTFKYDPFGRRIYKSSSTGTSIYAYDGDNLVEEANASGAVVARYSQGLNIDEPLAMFRSGTTSYYEVDGVDSVTSMSNSAGALGQTYTFDSFGNQTASSGSLTNPFQYTDREFDSETSLYYYRARYYDPKEGRFLAEDPLGPKDEGPSLYAYVGNNPTNSEDPLGLYGIDPSCKNHRCVPMSGGGPNNPKKPPQQTNVADAIQQGTDEQCSNLQGVDPKYRSCVQKSCKKGTIKCKDDKGCSDAGGYGGKILGIFTSRTANLCPNNWPDYLTPSDVGGFVIHEWAHGCGYNTGPGVPFPDKPKGSR